MAYRNRLRRRRTAYPSVTRWRSWHRDRQWGPAWDLRPLPTGPGATHAEGVTDNGALYDDGRIRLDEGGLTIRWYYPWGQKRIPYRAMQSIAIRPLSTWRGKWRIWGSGDFTHWFNLDTTRPGKESAIEIHRAGRVIPMITPDDTDTVARIISEHLLPDHA